MSRVTRHKHVVKEMMEEDYALPKENQEIVRVVSSRGNNLHEVQPAQMNTSNFLVSMPNKFRRSIWVKRGDFVLVEPIEEGDKVKAEIVKILTPQHVKEYTKAGVWPKQFTPKREHSVEDDDSDDDEAADGGAEGFIVKNKNRRYDEDDDDDDDDSDDTDDSDGDNDDEDNIKSSNKGNE